MRIHVGFLVVSVAACLFATACMNEADQMLPVSSSTGSSASKAPAATEAARRSNGLVRFVQAIPEVKSVDVYSNDMRAFVDVAYGSVTPYRELPQDRYTFHVRPAGQDVVASLADESEGISAGHHYTVVAFRDAGKSKATIRVFED